MKPELTTASSSGLLLTPQVVAALIALLGVVLGLFIRDVVVSMYLARRKRKDEIDDRKAADVRARLDLVRLYGDPLRDAVRSLKFRLQEIVEMRQGRYLLSDAPKTAFLTYKRISTLYRIAALLGWIRAIRRERGYLDPDQASSSSEMQSISDLEAALADGTHVELQRLDELAKLWLVKALPPSLKVTIANLIDAERARFLAIKGVLGARDLSVTDQAELAERCAAIIRQHASADIPAPLVAVTAGHAAAIFGIKEAYIYRDWQAAIGDLMIQEEKNSTRHFSVIGFGAFEDMVLAAETGSRQPLHRWLDRLEALVHDLDMGHEGIFDARRDQLRRMYECCGELEAALDQRLGS